MAILTNVKVYWCKALGEPVDKFNPRDGKEWTIDFALNKDHLKQMKAEGVTIDAYVKNKGDDRGDFYSYRRNAIKNDGEPSKPIKIVDVIGDDWNPKNLIGNGSFADIQYVVNEVKDHKGNRGKPAVLKVRISKLVEYARPNGQYEDFDYAAKPSEKEEW